MEGKGNTHITLSEICKNSIADVTDLCSKLLNFLPIKAIHVGEISQLGWLIGCQVHSVGQFFIFSAPAVSVNLQHPAIIPTYPMILFISMLGQSKPF
jgi:hypothetical protein